MDRWIDGRMDGWISEAQIQAGWNQYKLLRKWSQPCLSLPGHPPTLLSSPTLKYLPPACSLSSPTSIPLRWLSPVSATYHPPGHMGVGSRGVGRHM